MGIEILYHGSVDTVTKWYLYYRWKNRGNTGFSFPCNEDGDLLLDQMSELEEKIYEAVEFGEFSKDVELVGYIRECELVRKYPIGRCICGEEIELKSTHNKCPNCSCVYTQLGTEGEER